MASGTVSIPVKSRVMLILCLACLSILAMGKGGFMRNTRQHSARKVKMGNVQQEMDSALTEVMGHGHGVDSAQIEATQAQILPMFESMPKNMYGHVGLDALQYMVHRHFGFVHGWSVRGFNPSGQENISDVGAVKILKEKVPRYVEMVLESKLENQGFSVTDVVALVAVLERMIFDEGVELLEASYRMHDMDTAKLLTETELQMVMKSYMLIYSFAASATNQTHHFRSFDIVQHDYPTGHPSSLFGLAELEAVLEETKVKNPFGMSQGYSFDTALQGVARTNEAYGAWSNQEECVVLKEGLMKLDSDGTGRVRLNDFYAAGSVGATWGFTETPEYLRGLGVLDDSSPTRGPQLMIPNYVQSMSNCIDVSSFYSICCFRECEGILGSIEKEFREPEATPAKILSVVQRLINAREEEPRNLTLQLTSQLEAVAEMHEGKVPIHGRLFQQWLHYAFPYECPYPSKRDTVDAVVISEWVNMTGSAALYTREQLQEIVSLATEKEDEKEEADEDPVAGATPLSSRPAVREMSAWTMEEELYVGYHHQGPRMDSARAWAALGMLAKLGMVLGGLFGLGDFASKRNKGGGLLGILGISGASAVRKDLFV